MTRGFPTISCYLKLKKKLKKRTSDETSETSAQLNKFGYKCTHSLS